MKKLKQMQKSKAQDANIKRNEIPKLMGIVNSTPDSFSDGGDYDTLELLVEHAKQLVADGADILDIGGESTRPGATLVSDKEEMERVIPIIGELRSQNIVHPVTKKPIEISIDSMKPVVVEKAFAHGATIWNDVSALTYDANSIDLAASLQCPVILMHMNGFPKDMQIDPRYDNVVESVAHYLQAKMAVCLEKDIAAENLIIDPGFGFGKTFDHNLSLLCALKKFVLNPVGARVLVGISRKNMIETAMGGQKIVPQTRIGGTVALAIHAARQGVQWLRVHDVAQIRQALLMDKALISHPAFSG